LTTGIGVPTVGVMRRVLASLAIAALLVSGAPPSAASASATAPGPDVYAYLDDPRMTGEGQQPPHAELRPYATVEAAGQQL
jgi:beta-galactosidase